MFYTLALRKERQDTPKLMLQHDLSKQKRPSNETRPTPELTARAALKSTDLSHCTSPINFPVLPFSRSRSGSSVALVRRRWGGRRPWWRLCSAAKKAAATSACGPRTPHSVLLRQLRLILPHLLGRPSAMRWKEFDLAFLERQVSAASRLRHY
jgi:hypothetical protein